MARKANDLGAQPRAVSAHLSNSHWPPARRSPVVSARLAQAVIRPANLAARARIVNPYPTTTVKTQTRDEPRGDAEIAEETLFELCVSAPLRFMGQATFLRAPPGGITTRRSPARRLLARPVQRLR
jgi:hypothetical protein